MTDKYWTFERDGEIFDAQFSTQEEAQQWADEGFADECADEGGWRNGETTEADIDLLECEDDEDTGERKILQRIPSTVEYEHYHGDMAEHGTWHSGGGGVL